MKFLIIGLLAWSVIHLIPSCGIALKNSLISHFGEGIYKAIFSLSIILSLVLIVWGWRSVTPIYLYHLPEFVKPISLVLLFIGFILFGATPCKTRIKRIIRHPQMLSVVLWSVAHLLVNSDSRSVILFGALGCWAILEMIFINRREGVWKKPELPSWKQEIKCCAIGLAMFIVVVLLHPYIAGVPII